MIKFLVALVLTALLSFAGALFFPWWIIAVAAFVVAALIHQRPYKAFIAGFLGLFLLWGLQSFIIDAQNQHLLAPKIAALFQLGNSSAIMILITATVGGLVGGLSALTASFTRETTTLTTRNRTSKQVELTPEEETV